MAQCCAAGQLTSTQAGSWALPLDLSAQPGGTLTSQGTAFLGFFLYVLALSSPPLNFRPNLGLWQRYFPDARSLTISVSPVLSSSCVSDPIAAFNLS